jgi:four helix bundle protein
MRAIDSVGANISEGYGRGTPGQLRQFYGYALGSALESIYWLERAIARELVDKGNGVQKLQALRLCTASLEHLISGIAREKK